MERQERITALRRALGEVESGATSAEEALRDLGVSATDREHQPALGSPGTRTVGAGEAHGGEHSGPDRPGAGPTTPGLIRTRSGWLIAQRPNTGRPDTGRPDTERPDTQRPGDDAAWADRAREIVLRRLEAQGRSRAELAAALAERQVPEPVADAVLDRMVAVGLVDDAAFARSWVSSRQQRKYLSRRMLIAELRAKGVAPELADEATRDVDEDDEYSAALALIQRRLPAMADLDPSVRRRRLAGLLARRGFGSGLVFRVLDDTVGRGH